MFSCLLQKMKIPMKEGNYVGIRNLYDIITPPFALLPIVQYIIINAQLDKYVAYANMRCD